MYKNRIDAFFHMASHGDNEAYKLLYKEFVNRARYVIKHTIKIYSKYEDLTEDFCDLVDDLFFQAINEYEPEKTLFSSYVDYLFTRKLVAAVRSEIHRISTFVADVDFDDEEEINGIELLSDPTQPSIQNEIAMMDFKVSVASPNKYKTRERRQRDKILTLQYAGFSNTEICKKLNITYCQLRRIQKRIQDDEDISNIKLDLK